MEKAKRGARASDPPQHLKPLSCYSRMISGGSSTTSQADNSPWISSPFCNLKIEIMNIVGDRKRSWDDSCSDEGYETPAKKVFVQTSVSQGAACSPGPSRSPPKANFPLTGKDGVEAEAIASEGARSGHHSEPSRRNSSPPRSDGPHGEGAGSQPEKVALKLAYAFDLDVEEILCLSPAASDTQGSELNDGPGDEEVRGPGPAGGHATGGRYVMVEGEGDGSVEEREEGYFSRHYLEALRLGETPARDVASLTPPVTASPLASRRIVLQGKKKKEEVEEGEEASLPPDLEVLAAPLSCVEHVESLEGSVEEVFTIGSPLCQSSVCLSPSRGGPGAGGEDDVVEGGASLPVQEHQVMTEGEEDTVQTSYETTLPLQVKVKSVVVVPRQQPAASVKSQPVSIPPEQVPKTMKTTITAMNRRPVCFNNKDWQREKRLYVESVDRHLRENAGASQDVMTELLSLVTHVNGQGTDANGRHLQHPSDFTRRNYQKRFGVGMPTIPLDKWWTQNSRNYQRFAKVPKIFERSSVP